jgi:acyl dehydratase
MIDPAIEGTDLGTVRFPLDRSKLAELARAFHDDDPVWHDPEAAAAAGFDDVPVPPTVTVLADHWRPDGALGHALAIGLDLKRVLHGEAAWEHLLPVRLGDELTATTTVAGVTSREGRRGGMMTLVTLETTFVNQRGELAARRRDTLIETGAQA